ncbi:MAG: YmdB family metallophosphoesterase [Deltaproteobacteria bacterium]|nr:YmdB family metallophosphoesterase [Deltaproteobacteria bacterium]
MTRVLFLGDIFGKVGRLMIRYFLPDLMARERIDLALANGENAAGGVGITPGCALDLLNCGLSALSGGNHTFKYPEIRPVLEDESSRLIRPANFPEPCPGRGHVVLETKSGVRVGFGNLMGRLFMNSSMDCPFRRAETLIQEMENDGANLTLIDFHAEATSEKRAMAYFLDGRLGALLGTHTHVQTSDAQILPQGLAYVTDVGMTGPHGSVIGMNTPETINVFLTGRNHRFKASTQRVAIEGAIVEFNDLGKAVSVETIRVKDAREDFFQKPENSPDEPE